MGSPFENKHAAANGFNQVSGQRDEGSRLVHLAMDEPRSRQLTSVGSAALGSGSVLLAAVEAVCTFFVALSKLGILVGFTSLLSGVIVSRYHQDAIRLPVLAIAAIGAIMNLVVLWNATRLRNSPSAAWRKRPLSRRERWRIGMLIGLSIVTLGLVVAEFSIHPLHHL